MTQVGFLAQRAWNLTKGEDSNLTLRPVPVRVHTAAVPSFASSAAQGHARCYAEEYRPTHLTAA